MRRKDREVTDFHTILEIVDQCHVLRLGLSDGEYPYIVPVNFGYQVEEGKLFLYFHGARAGRKYELLSAHPVCSFEMDLPLEMVCIADKQDVTMGYKSVMGKAKALFLEGEEKRRAVDEVLMARYEKTRDFEYNRSALSRTAVVRLEVTEITGKRNLIPKG